VVKGFTEERVFWALSRVYAVWDPIFRMSVGEMEWGSGEDAE